MPGAPHPKLDEVIGEAERLKSSGRANEAAALYERWIAGDRTAARCVALFNLGVLRSDLGDLNAAEDAYLAALTINPALHQARINAGLVAERKNNDVEAVRHWLAVTEAAARGDHEARGPATIALNHIGRLQETRRHYSAAESALAHSLQLDPAQPDAIQHWVHLRQKQCAWPVHQPLPGVTANALMAATSPLAMLALHDDPALQWLASHLFVTRKYANGGRPLEPSLPRTGGPLRIGYLSGDLCTHAVGLLMPDLLEAHDRTRVHVTAFDFSPEDGTAHRARIKAACDAMVDVRAMSDRAAAEAIRAREVDVLIDMHGLSSGARPGILALRPAPLMGAFLGFIGTTALPELNFVITDRWTTPAAMAPFMTEQPLYVEGSLIPLSHKPVEGQPLTRASVGLPADAVVFACFNNIYKITPTLFECWLRILRRSERSVLWLLDDNQWATQSLITRARENGIDSRRLIFAGRSTHAEYRQRLTLADVYLDTYPYNAGSTARDVLDALVPLVTLSGRTPVSRMAGGLLHAAGLGDLVTASLDGYEHLAVELAADGSRLAMMKRRMIESIPAWKLAPVRFVKSLEDALILRAGGLTDRAPSTARC